MKFFLAALSLSTVSAFGPPVAPSFTPSNTEFAYGLPGSLDPAPEFDPLGFAAKDYETVKQYREAELQHGRVGE